MIAPTVERVPSQTAEEVNQQIEEQTAHNVAQYLTASRAGIDRRLAELDEEWDIERTLDANAAMASLVGLTLGATVDRRWFLFPAAVAGFLLQHAMQGRCPPLPIFRRLGFRTQSEIDYERYSLKFLRGDFQHIQTQTGTQIDSARQIVDAMSR